MPHYAVKVQNREHARSMRSDMTDEERKLWRELRGRRLKGLKFRRQLPIGPYIVDFACPDHRLIVELDGGGHSASGQAEYDVKRTEYLKSEGWTVLRFWNHEVTRDIGQACDQIIRELQDKGVTFS